MHRLLTTSILALSALLRPTLAVSNSAIVTIESSHGGAGQGLTNLTVTIPLTATYTNHSALDEVSTLYLVGAIGVPVDSVTCTPFRYKNGSGDAGLPFNTSSPSFISTNTVDIGSIVCISTDISYAPPSGPPGGPKPLPSSKSGNLTRTMTSQQGTSASVATSTLVKTKSAGGGPVQSTVTSTVPSASGGGAATGGPSSTSSGTVPLSSGNAASGLTLGSEFFAGLALAGFGLAFAL